MAPARGTAAPTVGRTSVPLGDGDVASGMAVSPADDYLRNHSISVTAGVQRAIDAAVAAARTGPAVLIFAPGKEYRLASLTPGTGSVLSVTNATGPHRFRIDGRGARFVVTTPRAGFLAVDDAAELTVANFSVDYDPLPITQGVVTAVQGPRRYTMRLDPGFPSLMQPQFLEATDGRWMIIKEKAAPTRHKVGSRNLNVVEGWVDRGARLFDVTLQFNTSGPLGPKVGDPVVHIARYDQYPSFGVSRCGGCVFEVRCTLRSLHPPATIAPKTPTSTRRVLTLRCSCSPPRLGPSR